MKHSKLPWAVFNQTDIFPAEYDYGQNRYIADCSPLGYFDNPGASLLTASEMRANTAFIVKACNDHDTLKAIADLHDELVDGLEKILARVERNDGCKAYIHELVTALLAKAKEIK